MTLSWATYIWYSMLVNLSISTLLMTQIGWISAKVEHVELITKPKIAFWAFQYFVWLKCVEYLQKWTTLSWEPKPNCFQSISILPIDLSSLYICTMEPRWHEY
jgi:hypothetical protein